MKDQYYESWLKHRMVLHDLLEGIGDEHVFFKPWEKGFSLGELAVHMASSADMFLETIKQGQFVPPSEPSTFETMDDVREIVHALTEKSKRDFAVIEETQLNKEIDIFGYKAPASYWMESLRDHEIHHKGQLFVYARMTGSEKVPFFTLLPTKA